MKLFGVNPCSSQIISKSNIGVASRILGPPIGCLRTYLGHLQSGTTPIPSFMGLSRHHGS